MKYTIRYQETVKRVNRITIEVENENKGEKIADALYDKVPKCNSPQDILIGLHEIGIKVTEVCEGAEDVKYEIL